MKPLFRDKRVVIFVRMINDLPTEISRKRIVSHSEKVTFKKPLTFILDTSNASFRIGRRLYYLVDIKTGQVTRFASNRKAISPEIVDSIMVRNLAKQLVAGLQAVNVWSVLGYVLLGIGTGFGFGWIVSTLVNG